MNNKKPIILGLLLTALATPTLATNGYWSHGYGAVSKSLAGACVAMVADAMCAATNPATLVHLGNRYEFGIGLFSPKRGYHANDDYDNDGEVPHFASITPGTYDSKKEFFLIPHFAYNRKLDENSTVGMVVGANGGMNTHYGTAVFENFANPLDPSTYASSPTGIDMKQLFISIPYAVKLNSAHSFGIEPILAIQSLAVTGLEPFTGMSIHPGHVTNNGTDYSYGGGVRAGWLWQVNDSFSFGASYQSRLYMTEFDDYKGLLAEEGDFDIPPNYDIGFAFKPRGDLTLSVDYQRILFSDIAAVGNSSVMSESGPLGADDGLGFGWDDIDIIKLGVEWQYSSDLTLRAGYSQASDAFPGTQALFNILAPAVIKRHYTIGFGKKLDHQHELNMAFTYAPTERLYGTNEEMTGPQTGYLEMDQWELEVGYVINF